MGSNDKTVSHKRTSSTAGNTTSPPQTKVRIASAQTLTLQEVFIVVRTDNPGCQDPRSETQGVYLTLQDANNCVRRIANTEFSAAEEWSSPKWGTEDDGRVYWESDDVGEGEQAELRIERWEVKAPGSEEDVEFEVGKEESGSEDEGDR
ncbi:hypothetical protein G7Y89_g10697 [Cudoniella acicularis]|uniref:Uncharacterized protein n=1 Tax=Cudoniella acicularis TaxID=354080 RepID=A0A8H4RDC2_9HELO|nr:hypothetical protein G7Y89_g10697 [Cudoniella acicularis]